jgi:hypothetical protein
MADQDYEIAIRTKREGNATAEEAAAQTQLAAAVDRTTKATKEQTQANVTAAAALKEINKLEREQAQILQQLTGTGGGGGQLKPGQMFEGAEDKKAFEDMVSRRNDMAGVLQQIRDRIALTKEENQAHRESVAAGQQKTLNEAMKDAEANVRNLTPATMAYIQSLNVQDEVVKRATGGLFGLRGMFSSLGRQLTGMAGLGAAVFNPITLAIVGTVAVAKNLLSTLLQASDVPTASFKRMEDTVRDVRDAMRDAAREAQQWAAATNLRAQRGETFDEASTRGEQVAKAFADAERQVLDAAKSTQEAQLRAQEDAGLVTHKDAILKKLALDEWYLRQRRDLEDKQEKDRVDRLSTRVGAARGAMRDAAQDALDSQPALNKATSARVTAQGRLSADRENLKAVNDEIKQLEEKIAEQNDIANDPYAGTLVKRSARDLRTKLTTQVTGAYGIKDRLEGTTIPRDEAKAAAADQAFDAAKAKTDELRQTASDLAAEFRKMSQELKTANALSPIGRATRGVTATGAADVAEAGAAGQLGAIGKEEGEKVNELLRGMKRKRVVTLPGTNVRAVVDADVGQLLSPTTVKPGGLPAGVSLDQGGNLGLSNGKQDALILDRARAELTAYREEIFGGLRTLANGVKQTRQAAARDRAELEKMIRDSLNK